MVDILGLVLSQFSSGSITGVCTQPGTGLCAPESGALVTGDRSFSRPLLLLSALTAASELAVKVLYFTQSQIQSLPISFQGARRAECLKKIRFVYPKTLEELLEDVASLHELVRQSGSLPSLLIVDGLEQYVCGPAAQDRTPQEAQSAAAHVVALLHDTAAFLTQKLGARSQCRVIVSFQPEWEGQGGCPALVSDPILSVLERYLQVRCTTEKVRRGEEPNEWLFCLTGPGLQADGDGKSEERLQWRVVLKSNGTLDFCPISRVKEDTLETLQNPVEVKDD
uniref:SWIM-type zinc finger 7 associated protein 1 n=1 Tax=Astyanax mexicanus TaxID=7994 RepID=A0A3B1K9E0_ASTMX